jgi:hypothetical protein
LANQCFFDSAAQSANSQSQILFRFLRPPSGPRGPIIQPLSGDVCLANGQMSGIWGGWIPAVTIARSGFGRPMTGSRPGWQAT